MVELVAAFQGLNETGRQNEHDVIRPGDAVFEDSTFAFAVGTVVASSMIFLIGYLTIWILLPGGWQLVMSLIASTKAIIKGGSR